MQHDCQYEGRLSKGEEEEEVELEVGRKARRKRRRGKEGRMEEGINIDT